MSKEQQTNQINYLKHQNQQAYLVYCQQIITYLTVLNWLRVMYIANESTIYNEKRTLSPKNLNQAKHQGKAQLKALKHKEKLQNKEKVALGKSLARYEYDAYGKLLTEAGSSEQPFGFTGYQIDTDTGLYYANARYYDSSTARFNREDPIEGNINIPPSLHRYNYAFNNPTVYIDPDGQCVGPITFFVCAAAIGAAFNVGVDFAIQSYTKNPEDSYDYKSLAVSGVTGAVSGVIGGTIFNSSARASIAFAGAFTADTAIDTAGNYVLSNDKENFNIRNNFKNNARNNLLAFGFTSAFGKVADKFNIIDNIEKIFSKSASEGLDNVRKKITTLQNADSRIRKTEYKAFGTPIKHSGFKQAAKEFGMVLSVRGKKIRTEIKVALGKDLPEAKKLLASVTKINGFLASQSLDGFAGGLFDFGKNDEIQVSFENDVLSIVIPNKAVNDPKIYNDYINLITDELGVELPNINLSGYVNKNGVLPDDFELTQTFEQKSTEEIIIKEDPEKPGIKGD